MTERPILFKGGMVRAILEGRKTQTRRALEFQPLDVLTKRPPWEHTVTRKWNGHTVWFALIQKDPNRGTAFGCRFGEVGDKLWVKETWAKNPYVGSDFIYRATEKEPERYISSQNKWRSSLHMPKTVSRLSLEITNIRVERLHDIGKDGRKAKDVLAEGITDQQIEQRRKYLHPDDAPAHTYGVLWDSINGKGSWAKNPWVWVIEFKKL
jgi:hypothetical protein